MRVHGLEACQGDTAFAFLVLRLQRPADRGALVDVIQRVASMIPDAESFIAELPEDLEESMRLVAMPWSPPEAGHAVEVQRRLIESVPGIEAAWFFQTGTSLPSVDDDDDDDDDQIDDDDEVTRVTAASAEGWGDEELTGTAEMLVDTDEDDEDDEDDDVVTWSYGPPPRVMEVRFPVDGYPAILDQLDWEDFGIAFKLGGDWLPGESTVLLGFHALWLAPYGGRYRNAAVTVDRKHHTAHLWVDRFAVPVSADDQVHHLLWVLSKLDEVVPVLHARFAGATMAQKYGGLIEEDDDPFVLGGNPLLAVHAASGEVGVDAWIEAQTAWSKDEVAQMLRELAIEIVTRDDGEVAEEVDEDEDDDEDGEEDADEEVDEDDDEDVSRYITTYAGELLAARAAAGKLDARVAARLRPLLAIPEKYEHRRTAVVRILGALSDRASVPQLIEILEGNPIESALDSTGKEDFLVHTATALGTIADPSAIPALSRLVVAPGAHNDDTRPAAAEALASCLAASPEPRDIDDAVLTSMLDTIRERDDGELNAELHFAYGRIARQLAPARREVARQRLSETESARDDSTAVLAREVALALARGGEPDAATAASLRPLIHGGLTGLDYDHDYTVRNIRVALRVAEALPHLVDPADLVWLTRFAEPDLRTKAHALLAQLGHALAAAPVFDRRSVQQLSDPELVRLIGEPHVIGRAVLVGEAGRRKLASARGEIIKAAHDVVSNARHGGANLLDPDTRLLEAAVAVLRTGPLDADTIALFDRMLRHSNFHVKWELLQEPPDDDRLIAGMFQVLAERWGWQERTAKQWLARRQGTPAYEAERQRAGSPVLVLDEDAAGDDDDVADLDDEDIN